MKISEILNLSVSVIAIVTSIVSVFITATINKKITLKLSLHSLTLEEQSKIIKQLYDLEDYLDNKILKYNAQNNVNTVISNITTDEKMELNKYISEINLGLAKIFMTMPDAEYKGISENWPLEPRKLAEIAYDLLILFRQSQYPDTEFNQPKNIKFLYKIK